MLRFPLLCIVASLSVFPIQITANADEPFGKAKTILFLGDSITHAGHYISLIEEQMYLHDHESVPDLINLGLPSETCSGLSEPAHPFPRPNVHERLDRALAKIKPDLVVACYGMNDGIYYPLQEERFAKYRDGIKLLIQKVKASGAKLILMTPPAFDPLPMRRKGKLLPAGSKEYAWHSIYEDYDDVMQAYARWIVTLKDDLEMVIDLHTACSDFVTKQRMNDPEFTMSPDGVHLNDEGHRVLAVAVLKAIGIGRPLPATKELLPLVSQRQTLMRNAWLEEVGHTRPGIKPGLPLSDAKQSSERLKQEIVRTLPR